MSELARVETRIRTLGQLSEVVRAMRGMASSRLREAEEAAEAVESFARTVEDAVDALAAAEDRHDGRHRRDGAVLLLVGAEHGFVGGFSESLARELARLREPGERVHIVGRRTAAIAAAHGIAADIVHPQGSHAQGIVVAARGVATALGAPQRLRLLHARPARGGSEIRSETVLPRRRPGDGSRWRPPPLTHLPPPLLYRALLEELVFAAVVRAMLDAFAAENDARLRAMERAERNIRDRIAGLEREWQRLRQESITAELLDIVAGAEAVGPER